MFDHTSNLYQRIIYDAKWMSYIRIINIYYLDEMLLLESFVKESLPNEMKLNTRME